MRTDLEAGQASLRRDEMRLYASQLRREEWLRERRTAIGSSDAAAVCGRSPWKTAYEVWLDKLGLVPDLPPSEPMRWGLKLESVIAEAYEEHTGTTLTAPGMVRSDNHRWMAATIDRVRDDGRIVELKSASAYDAKAWGPAGSDDIPEHYLIQVQHQLAVTGADIADVAALIGGNDFRVYTVPRNAHLIDTLVAIEGGFWDKVETKQQPAPDWCHETTLALIKAAHPAIGGRIEVTDESALDDIASYLGWRGEAKEAEQAKDEAQARLIARMGSAGEAIFADGTIIKRPLVRVPEKQVRAYEYYNFRVTPAKGHHHG